MSLILKQETASSVPTPTTGKATLYLTASNQLNIKDSTGNVAALPAITSTTNTQVFFNDTGGFGQSSNFVFNNSSSTLTVANLSVTGTLTAGDISVSSIANGTSNVDIVDVSGNVTTSVGGNANIFVVTGTGANVNGYLSASGNVTAGNLVSTGNVTATSATTATFGDNTILYSAYTTLNTFGIHHITGANPQTIQVATNSGTSGIAIGAYGAANSVVYSTGGVDFLVGVTLVANSTPTGGTSVAQITSSGIFTSGLITATGNINGGNIITAGIMSSTGNATHGNVLTGGIVTATGNVTGGNLVTSGAISATGNATAGNLITTGIVSATGGATFSANVAMGSQYITGLHDPVNPQDAATKNYVDTTAQGLHVHASANAATTGTLATATSGTVTYNNGSSGVGATLTTTGSYTTIDGVNITTVGTRILVKNEANTAWNGVYTYTSSTVITRATDFDVSADVAGGDFLFVTSGSTLADTGWVQTTDAPVTIGTSPIVFSQFSGAGTYTAGTGLTLTGTTFSVNAIQTQVTAVGTLTSLSVSGNANIGNVGATTFVGNLSGTGNSNVGNLGFGSGTIVGTGIISTTGNANVGNINVIGSGQIITGGNISAGTITAFALSASGNSNVANIGATIVTATGNVQSATFLVGANLSVSGNANVGNIGATNIVGTLTTAAQTNITSVGTLSSVSVSGAATVGSLSTSGNITGSNIISTTNHLFSVATGISAAGSTQGTATAITKDFNVVSTVASGAGVVFPTAVAGMRLTVINTSANALLVYPAVNGVINSLAANAAYSTPAGSRLDFISTTTTQWYTLNATYN